MLNWRTTEEVTVLAVINHTFTYFSSELVATTDFNILTSNSFPKSLPDLTNLFQLKELIIWIYIMTRDLTDQKGCGSMVPVLPTLTWYIFVISWHIFNKMKYYKSEFCIRNSIELNWCGHYKKKIILFSKVRLIHNFKRKIVNFK